MITHRNKTLDFSLKFLDEDELGENQIEAASAGRKRLFSKELRCMMYGFGDDQNPYTESVDMLEDLVIEFITETTHRYLASKSFYISASLNAFLFLELWKLERLAVFK